MRTNTLSYRHTLNQIFQLLSFIALFKPVHAIKQPFFNPPRVNYLSTFNDALKRSDLMR